MRAVRQRLRKLPARVVVYLLLAAALFEDCGYQGVWRKLTSGLAGLSLPRATATGLWHARCRLGVRPMRAVFEVLRGPASAVRTAQARWALLIVYQTIRIALTDAAETAGADPDRSASPPPYTPPVNRSSRPPASSPTPPST